MEIVSHDRSLGTFKRERVAFGGPSERDETLKAAPVHKKRRILVVDDDIHLVNVLREDLEAQGYSVMWATDGTMAKLLAWEWKPDLLMTDIVMPVLDGVTMVDEIFAVPGVQKVPVIFMSGKATADFHPQQPDVPFRLSLVKKPFALSDINLLVHDLLSYSAH